MEGKGGEVRRIHIIYFLSHLGHDEHPHLIRVHHFNRSGVYLRDVKRWLADLRGKDMPEAFAWSYKRRYKTGYVWQDLLDHDLITPLADNEYVLKGSQLVHASFDYRSYCESKIPESKQQKQQEQPLEAEEAHSYDQHQHQTSPKESFQIHPDSKTNTSTDFSSEITEESSLYGSERSTVTNDSIKIEQEKNKNGEKLETSFLSKLSSRKNKNKKKKNNNKEEVEKANTQRSSYSSSSFTKSKSHSSGASGVFRNFVTCGSADTNDAVLLMLNRANKTKSSSKPDIKDEILKGEKLAGSARVHGTACNQPNQDPPQQHTEWKGFDDEKQGSQKKQQQSRFQKLNAACTAYKPMAKPKCSNAHSS